MKIKSLVLFITFLSVASFAQEKDKKIMPQDADSERYFLPRENIHLHFNKSSYLSLETIWFKGYVIDKATGYLNLETTNVYVSLLDKNMNLIETRMFLATNGVIDGHWEIDENSESGKYYIHTYTNFMNNFEEDESSLYALEILNTKDAITLKNRNAAENASIEISIEGGQMIVDCHNTIGVRVTDCNGIGIQTVDISVLDGNNNEINRFSTNTFGYGAFQILGTKNEDYKVVVNLGPTRVERTLPRPIPRGLTMSVQNPFDKNFIMVEVKTNPETLKNIKGKSYSIIVHKNEQYRMLEFDLEQLTTQVPVDKKDLFEGINFIRLVDSQNKSLAVRIIYNHVPHSSSLTFETHKISKDSIRIRGKLPNQVANFSISALPSKTQTDFEKNAIGSQLKFNSYLNTSLESFSYYFKDYNRAKHFELDLFLLNQNVPKYNWEIFLDRKPIISHPFEKGLNIEITLNQVLPQKNKSVYKGNLISTRDMLLYQEELTASNSFLFKNVIARDSTELIFTLEKNGVLYDNSIHIYTRVLNKPSKFLRSNFKPKTDCEDKLYTRQSFNNFEFPINSKTIALDNVELVQKREQNLTKIREFGNRQARAVKINPETEKQSLVQILTANGYVVNNLLGNFTVYNFGRVDLQGNPTVPVIFLDGIPLNYNLNNNVSDQSNSLRNNLEVLRDLNIQFIDEIYFNRDDIFESRNGYVGSIKIYTRKDIPISKRNVPGLKSIKISAGFQLNKAFTNPYISDFQSEGFQKYGTIYWIPNVSTDIDGNFEFKFPNLNQESVILNIQGIDSEGNLYFENRTLEINPLKTQKPD
ncbi:MAG: hypothetical protein ACK4FS_00115 [Flavobacterium sp.]